MCRCTQKRHNYADNASPAQPNLNRPQRAQKCPPPFNSPFKIHLIYAPLLCSINVTLVRQVNSSHPQQHTAHSSKRQVCAPRIALYHTNSPSLQPQAKMTSHTFKNNSDNSAIVTCDGSLHSLVNLVNAVPADLPLIFVKYPSAVTSHFCICDSIDRF